MIAQFIRTVLRDELAEWARMGDLDRAQRKQVKRLQKSIAFLEEYIVGVQPDGDIDTEGNLR